MNSYTAAAALELSLKVIAVASVLGSSELLWLWKKGRYTSDGLWSWPIIRQIYSDRIARILSPAMSPYSTLVIIILRMFFAVCLLVAHYPSPLATGSIALLLILHLLMTIRTQWGDEGADQMTLIVLAAGLAGSIQSGDGGPATVAAMFVGAQVSLSYVASGVAKLNSPVWRSGRALQGIMNHHTYGHPKFSGYLTSAGNTGAVLCAGVIAFQTSFLLFYLTPMPLALIFVVAGACFHAGIAYFMRLNLFFLCFVGTYPCLIFTHSYVRELIGLG